LEARRQVTAALVALENAKALWNGRAGIGFEILTREERF
jgi:hypothetical protein